MSYCRCCCLQSIKCADSSHGEQDAQKIIRNCLGSEANATTPKRDDFFLGY